MPSDDAALPASEPPELRFVRDEPAQLPPFSTDVWTGRYVPRGILVPFRGQVGTPAPYALDSSSLVVRRGGEVLREGVDYVLDRVFGTLCLPAADAAPVAVTLSYRYALLRLDSIVREGATGARRRVRGVSHLTNPRPPGPRAGEIVEAHVLIDDRADGPRTFAVTAARADAGPAYRGRLPRAAARRVDHGALRLLFLGDSITEGGDASSEESTFRAVAMRRLRQSHPEVEAHTAATGGSRSVHWLDPDDSTCDWERVVSAAPHVTVVEFLNDAYLDSSEWEPAYDEVVARLHALGSEVVLLTPTFAMRATMNESQEADDGRPYVRFVREYAERRGLALIDVSSRWERLREEGLPYWTLLANGINHPDDRGHLLTGEFIADGLARMLEGEIPG